MAMEEGPILVFSHLAAADAGITIGPGASDNWSGTIGSLVPGFEGVGFSAKAPNLVLTQLASTYDAMKMLIHFRWDAVPGTDQPVLEFASGGTVNMQFGKTASGKWFARRGTTGTPQWISTGTSVVQDFDYVAEVAIVFHDTLGRVQIRINGADDPDLVVSAVDTMTSATLINLVNLINTNITVHSVHTARSTIGTFEGADFRSDTALNPRYAVLHANAAGFYQQFYVGELNPFDDPPGPLTPHVNEVDELVLDKTGTYLVTKSQPKFESFKFQSLPVAAKRVFSIQPSVALQSAGGAGGTYQNFLRIGGTDYLAAGKTSPTTNFQHCQDIWARTPVSPGLDEFTVAQVNAMECGVKRTAATGAIRFSQHVLIVQYSTIPVPLPPLPVSGQFLLPHNAHRMATCVAIEPRDGTEVFRFTDWPHDVEFASEIYTPTGGLLLSNHRRELSMEPETCDAAGLVTDDGISFAALRGRRFREAKVTMSIVDPKYPWQGPIDQAEFWVGRTRYDADAWEAELDGLARFLGIVKGHVFSRNCRYKLGDDHCGIQLIPLTKFDVRVSSIVDARRIFRGNIFDIPTGVGDGYYAKGELRWTVGQNADVGCRSEVKFYQESDRRIELQLPTVFPITTSDKFDLEPGCDFRFSTCVSRFANGDNFGGWRFIPGYKKLQT